jgi:hypothetical protein
LTRSLHCTLTPALQFHLKRFRYDMQTGDMGKVNSRFEFPKQLDVSRWLSQPGDGGDKAASGGGDGAVAGSGKPFNYSLRQVS